MGPHDAATAEAPPAPAPAIVPQEVPARPVLHAPAGPGRRRWIWAVVAIAVAVAAGAFGYPLVATALNTVSTDDAYVNGHVTFVAPRVAGQVARVLVDDNYRVKKGQLLVQLDKEPFEVQVNIRRARLASTQADLIQAEAQARALEGTGRSRRWKLQSAMEQVNNQVASLRAAVATLESRQATLVRARRDYERAEKLIAQRAISFEERDQRREAIRVAEAQVAEAQAQVQQIRVSLGLPVAPPAGKPLDDVPPDLEETYSAVRVAAADMAQVLAEIGLPLVASEARPKQILADLYKQDPGGDINKVLEKLARNAPTVKQAEAAVMQARRDLDQALLDLRYTDVLAEIDGVVTRRNVNPGNNVQVGQSLMAIRSIQDIWVDANFKETQLDRLRIGQPVDLYLDMYGHRRAFKGRVSGFTMGTGSTLALLPAQNATGNFVKVVQRLPVRIDLVGGNPEDAPLFVGLSVTPYVHFKATPTGPNAGRRLQQYDAAANAPRTAESGR